MKYAIAFVYALAASGHAAAVQAADPARQDLVAERGRTVMPFSLDATLHHFTRTAHGGEQRVLARDPADAAQVALVRGHLADIAARFRAGDYSAPAAIHGAGMPGLAQLRAAPPGALDIAYADVAGGGRIAYVTRDPALVAALHRWFDAQLADHGAHARAGHAHAH